MFFWNSEKNQPNETSDLVSINSKPYEFGNYFDNGLITGMTSTYLEKGNQKASVRFTNFITGNVSSVTLSVSSNNPQKVTVGLQEDDGNGNPTGNWLNELGINKTIIFRDLDRTFTFPDNVMIEENKIYHIVIEPENNNTSTNIKIKHYQTNTPYQPFNPDNLDIYRPDLSINSLFFDGNQWIEQEKWPSFLVSFEDGQKIGQPYTLAAGWVIRGETWVGQTFIPSSDYHVSKIAFVVSKEGAPDQPLFYGIQDEKNNILSDGFFIESEKLSWGKKWVEVDLDESVFFESEKLYRIYIYSSIPKGDEFYRVYGHEYSFDFDTGYGELRHRLTISHDSGKTWSAWKDADAIFRLTT